ncbi:MAG TPA: tRNA (5-methylaminomethyl-2-thiouridine)(34)-methyltransferase MnmD [Caulobacteraceae bacterium]|jgi:tRNA 5-methylaminomethyl-2-thiouridine biosynthesis bifunctional protein
MSAARSDEGAEIADWSRGGPPRSRRHGDVYYSAEDGLAESRAVFMAGCGLPEAWRNRSRFCVAELGFGTGLNIAALLHAWRATAPPDAQLHIFTVENDLITAAEAERALSAWPELSETTDALVSRWPGRARGFRRIDLPQFRATLDLAQLEAGEALEAWSGAADAWFLDGFSPSADPLIWRPEVLSLVARRSRPGARAASFTVAGAVRRALADAGFKVTRQPGHGRKRERLEAQLPGGVNDPARRRIAVVGAGIAGVSISRALAAQNIEPILIDARRPAASAVPAALAAPRLDAGLGRIAALFAQAAARATDLYGEIAGAVLARGVLQLRVGPKDASRFGAIAGSDLFEPGWLDLLCADKASERVGEPCGLALDMRGAVTVDTARVLAAWAPLAIEGEVSRIEPAGSGWRLKDAEGRTLCEADAVCVAAGAATTDLLEDIELTMVRGQATLASGVSTPALSFGGYATPMPGGVLFGATHDRSDRDLGERPDDDRRNLLSVTSVLPALGERLARATLRSWTGLRAATSDYLPLAGALPGRDGLFVLAGLGSRGFCLAPLLGEHVAALAAGLPSPLPAPLAALLDPGRFAARRNRRIPSR